MAQRRETSLDKSVIEFHGFQTGPKSALFLGTHGDELPSVETGRKIRDSGLFVESGLVRVVTETNPKAIRAGKRYKEADLMRVFQDDEKLTPEQRDSYEYRRAQTLKRHLEDVEVLLDAHNTSNEYTTPLTIAEPHAHDLAARLPIDLVVSGFDEFEPGGTDYYMNMIGKKALCTEAGWSGDPDAVQLTEEIIQAFLLARGHIDGETVKSKKIHRQIIDIYIAKKQFITDKKGFKDFEEVEPDTFVGTDGDEIVHVKDADHGRVTQIQGVKRILFASKVIRPPGQTGFLIATDREPIE